MSLTSILKQIDRVDQQQKLVYQRYNGKNKNSKKSQLIEEENEDKKIFGYSHSDILKKVNMGTKSRMQITRPSTAFESKTSQFYGLDKPNKSSHLKRARSAVKFQSNINKKYHFLFKEDIFDDNHHEIVRKNTLKNSEFVSQNKYFIEKMQKFMNDPGQKTHKLQRKSIKKQKLYFVRSFNANSYRSSSTHLNKNNKQNKTSICQRKSQAFQKSRKNLGNVQKNRDIELFNLTKINQQNLQNRSSIQKHFKFHTSQSQIHKLNAYLNQIVLQKYLNCQRKNSLNRSYPIFQSNIKHILPQKFIISLIQMDNLSTSQIKIIKKKQYYLDQKTLQNIQLNAVIADLMKKQNFIHLQIHDNKNLIYEEFLINKSWDSKANSENLIKFVEYYLKRFLMLDLKTSIQTAIKNSNIFTTCNVDIPRCFIEFIESLYEKSCTIFDKDKRLHRQNMMKLLQDGLSEVVKSKKVKGSGKKMVKTNNQFKKGPKNFLYSCEFFNICFFLLKIHSIQILFFSKYQQLKYLLRYTQIINRQTFRMKAQKNESVKVALRVRPLNKRQTQLNSPLCVETKDNILSIKKGNDIKDFVFDYVYGIETKQYQVYETCGYPLVQNALQGFNGTIFAYGQTGAGKTFSMVGDYKDPEFKGIIPRGFDHIITAIQTSQGRKYVVRSSFIEIYNEEIFDLLDMKGDVKKQLKQSPDRGVFIKDLKSVPVKSVDEMFKLLDFGNKNRSVAKTQMNATSSRSHALFTVHIESIEGADKIKASKLNFVDLAGSERQGKTGATGDTLKQGAKINLSLTALGNVINSLVDGKKGGHIPYRDSKLTRLLQDSLGGNTKTLMMASVSPADDNYDETLSTLRYAARARNIKNTPKVNQDPKDALIKEYMLQIQKLKKQLSNGGVSIEDGESSQELSRELERIKQKQKQLSQKQQEYLQMKIKMKQMQEIIMKKQKQTPEMIEKMKKRKLQKKKIMKNDELNENKVHDIQQNDEKDVNDQESENKYDSQELKKLVKKLRRKLKNAIQDKKDVCQEFEDQRQRLNECIRNLEGNLSLYRQIAEKFVSESDIAALKDQSTFDYETRQMTIPNFLLHDEKISLPKTLKKHEVDDLWKQKRKGFKMQIVNVFPDLKNQSFYDSSSQTKTGSSNKTVVEPTGNPFMQNRRVLKYINYVDDKYKQKQYNIESANRQTIFRRTNFVIRDNSNSQNKRPPSSSQRINSKTKLQSLTKKESNETSQERRPLSKGREKLEPIIKK